MKKKLKIIIPIIVIIIVAAIVAVFMLEGKKIAITGKSKVAMGLTKTLNSFEESEGVLDTSKVKILDSISKKPYEASATMSIDVEVEDLEELVGDEDIADLVNDIFAELSNTDITTKISVDQANENALMNLNLKNENLLGEISGEVAVTPDEIAFRSEELNEDYLVLTKEDLEDNSEYEEIFDLIQEAFTKDYSDFMFSEEELKHFSDTYGNILNDSVKNGEITSEKGEFEVNGSKTSCTKSVLKYNNDQFKELITKYITTFENDKKGREIIENKFNAIYGETLAAELIEQIDDGIADIKDSIDNIEDTTLEFITYGTAFKTYGTETKLTVLEDSAIIKETFNDDNTNIKVSFADEEIVNVTIKQSNNELSVDGNVLADGNGCEVNLVLNKSKIDLNLNIIEDEEVAGTLGFVVESNVKTNTEKELEQDSVIKVSLDVPVDDKKSVKGSVALNVSETMKVIDSIEMPDTSKAVSIMDTEELSVYVTDCQKGLMTYATKLQKSELVKNVIEMYSNYSSLMTKQFDMDDEINSDIDSDIDIDTTEAVDPEDLKDDITDWYSNLEAEEGSKKSEVIEEDMITDFDFLDYVTVNTYISWEEGTPTDEGYVGIEVTDSEDNVYEFYIDISKDKVYTESTVPFDTASISWNEF